ncbi:hypothetical protein GCM10007416_34170 [Kroppenstedtia guangzhouensis]|uniref:MPN domain-containing protein n=1 Tax=Kroppenstedtia guangzhouensis TaxID=1274356 RepID=A0ABQ1H431_9BACL|nr:JAB domain-containing protein [Kroppenstedtia guangzhouensis]GGA58132.1 hypothetical protein GCM10007416_34170 [Kroppenstedtia guangzhouensis]
MYKIPVYDIRIAEEGYRHVTLEIVGHHESPVEQVGTPRDAADAVRSYLKGVDREHFVVMLLSTKNKINGFHTCHIGSVNTTVVHPREVFKPAVIANTAGIIVAHNHPSGDPTPSREDVHITERLYEVGKIMGIELLDHIIIGDPGRYYSMLEKGVFGRF